MNRVALAAFGWFVPGGAYLLMRRYWQFAGFAFLVLATFIAGLALRGGIAQPEPAELSGLDGFTALVFQAGWFAKALAGAPFLVAQLLGGSGSLIASRLHEYGSVLLMMAGIFNVLGVSSALDIRKEQTR